MSDNIERDDVDNLLSAINYSILGDKKYQSISDDDVSRFLRDLENENTRKTDRDIRIISEYLVMVEGKTRKIEEIDAVSLDSYLSRFFQSVKKNDGSEYEPVSLKSYQSSLQRYLKQMGSTFNIISNITFARSRETLKCKQKELKSMGKGNKPKAAEELSDIDIDAMYDAKTPGSDNPHSLLHTMWMICCLNFGMRTGKETRNLQWGDIDIRNDDDGSEYLIFISERQTKTRPGDNPKNIRQIKPRAYATPEDLERCPVNAYKLYRQRRPPASCTPDSPFFLAVNNNRKEQSYWYKNAPLGVNKLYGIMKAMTEADDKRLTPYSMRKHLVQKLRDSGVPPNDIIQISGHKNVNSINNYSSMNTEKQKGISRILPNSNTASSTVTTADRNPDSAPMQGGFAMQSVSNRLQNQHFLTSLLSGNTINGNVNICLSSDMFNVSMSSEKHTANATTSNTCEDELPPKRPCLQ